ncbi:MAG: NifB/NifX family molybdenum-iron cluster-binding protein [Desulfurococcales archaeon]|jgi:predicted Fe-Mo cluster-binding NifX family protein
MGGSGETKPGNRVRVAIATMDGATIASGHFAHSTHFMIIDLEGGKANPVEIRENPLGYVPDTDLESQEEYGGGESIHPVFHRYHRYIHLHGVEKYRTLREEVLGDVDLIIAGGACRTSIEYFTSEGVKFVFADPGEPIKEIVEFISTVEYSNIPRIARLQKREE